MTLPSPTPLITFKKIAIGGCGLMGGSIGLRLKRMPSPPEVVGFGRTEETLVRAKERGAIDSYSMNPAEGVRGADLVILCAPVMSIPAQMERIADALEDGAIVTDVGSTKSWITSEAERLLPSRVRFIGSHPMAGSERDGIDSADPNLYEQAVTVVTLSLLSDDKSILAVKDFWRALGAIPLVLPAAAHDKIVASVSHLPHVLAALLVNVVDERSGAMPRTWELTAGGFRDTTRIASSNPNLWRDICLTNREALLEAIAQTKAGLESFESALVAGDGDAVRGFYASARESRGKVPAKGTGLLPSIFDLSVEAPDKPGVIADITGLLAKAGVNIIDIEIARVRETPDTAPVRVFFENESMQRRASSILLAAGYTVKG